MTIHRRSIIIAIVVLACSSPLLQAATYHVDSSGGADADPGTTAETAWKTLERASQALLKPGDSILLKRGERFNGSLLIEAGGTAEAPIVIAAYGDGPMPVIDAAGFHAGVHVRNAEHVEVRDLEITGDGGRQGDGKADRARFGVLVSAGKEARVNHVTLRDLFIHDIYPSTGAPHEGMKATTHLGYGVAVRGSDRGGSSHFHIEGCRIERTGFKAIELSHIRQAMVLDNRMKAIGGPAIQPGNVEDLVVRGNVVDGSGSSMDPRMHGRGSGIWPWTSKRVLIEHNTFKGARGKADSCGIHIDFNCSDVVVQYNLSIDNEGGFIEILGNNHNCAYRYNISVNDGARVKGENGAHQEGKILWTSGYVGRDREKNGPYNSYIHNNTVYVGPDSRSCFSISGTTDGLLVANNIFHILGDTVNVRGDQDWRKDKVVDQIPRAQFRNNVVTRADLIPDSLPVTPEDSLVGDVRFSNPGGLAAEDYIPRNGELVKDRGIRIEPLPGDSVGLRIGLAVETDILGNPIDGRPDIGAIELTRSSDD